MFRLSASILLICGMAGGVQAQRIIKLEAHPQVSEQAWPQWGGVLGDFVVRKSVTLADSWTAPASRMRWRRKLGEGYSAIVSDGSTLYTAYHEKGWEIMVALHASNGAVHWQYEVPVIPLADRIQGYGPGPHATPLMLNDFVIFAGVSGKLHCLEKQTGKLVWMLDLQQEYGKLPRKEEYGYTSSPLVYHNMLLVPAGGSQAGIVALRPQDGKLLWKSDSVTVSYTPPVLLRLLGRDQYVFFSSNHVIALDPLTGNTLWSYPCACNTDNHLTSAVACGEEHIWVAGQLDAGTRLLKLHSEHNRIKPVLVWEDRKLTQAHWNSIVVEETHLWMQRR